MRLKKAMNGKSHNSTGLHFTASMKEIIHFFVFDQTDHFTSYDIFLFFITDFGITYEYVF
jgi:hypothetical protein